MQAVYVLSLRSNEIFQSVELLCRTRHKKCVAKSNKWICHRGKHALVVWLVCHDIEFECKVKYQLGKFVTCFCWILFTVISEVCNAETLYIIVFKAGWK